jgi:hypothetical protein
VAAVKDKVAGGAAGGGSYMGLWRCRGRELHGALKVAVLNLHDLAHLVEDREDVVLL